MEHDPMAKDKKMAGAAKDWLKNLWTKDKKNAATKEN